MLSGALSLLSIPPRPKMTAVDRLSQSLLMLRWVAVLGQIGTILTVHFVLQMQLHLVPLLSIVGLLAGSNLFLVAFNRLRPAVFERWWPFVVVAAMGTDLLLLTALLYFSGGYTNPFWIFYFVNLCAAAVMLSAVQAWCFGAMAFACFLALTFDHYPLCALTERGEVTALRWRGNLPLEAWGLSVAFITCASVVLYFTTSVTTALRRQDAALRDAEQARARGDKLEALGTLAAGAAHELSSPLSTIAIISRELQVGLQQNQAPPQVLDDVSEIRNEVDRCRKILNRMSADVGQQTWEKNTSFSVDDLLDEILDGLTENADVECTVDAAAQAVRLTGPLVLLAQAIRGLFENALDASDGKGVGCTASVYTSPTKQRFVRLHLVDSGRGIPDDVLRRIGEPFFTTKPAGRGMGLGLFLARSVIERLGGQLHIASTSGHGTTVDVSLPCMDEAKAAAGNGTAG